MQKGYLTRCLSTDTPTDDLSGLITNQVIFISDSKNPNKMYIDNGTFAYVINHIAEFVHVRTMDRGEFLIPHYQYYDKYVFVQPYILSEDEVKHFIQAAEEIETIKYKLITGGYEGETV